MLLKDTLVSATCFLQGWSELLHSQQQQGTDTGTHTRFCTHLKHISQEQGLDFAVTLLSLNFQLNFL